MNCFKCGNRLELEEVIHGTMREFIEDIKLIENVAKSANLRSILIQGALLIQTKESYGINRDEETCLVCGYNVGDALAVHHLDENRENSDRTNLVVLCRNCHYLVHRKIIDLNYLSTDTRVKNVR